MKNVMFPRECFSSTTAFITTNFIYGSNNPDITIESCEADFDSQGYATRIKLPANFRRLTSNSNVWKTYWPYFWKNSEYVFDLDFKRLKPRTAYMCWDASSVRSYINIEVGPNDSITTAFAGATVNGEDLTLVHIKQIVDSVIEYIFIRCQIDTIIIDKCSGLRRGTSTTIPFTYCNVKHLIANGWSDQPMNLTSARFERDDMIALFNSLGNCATTATLTLGSTLLAKLTDEDKKIATDKGWTLA